MTKMCLAYENFVSRLKSNFGPLQGHVQIYSKVRVLAVVPRFQDFWELVENNA